MPMPESQTEMRMVGWGLAVGWGLGAGGRELDVGCWMLDAECSPFVDGWWMPLVDQVIEILPPSGVYLMALSTRLSRISRRPSRSARTRQGCSALIGAPFVEWSVIRLASAVPRWSSMHFFT